MPFVHGKNSVIWVWDSNGTCRNISGDKNSITMSWNRNNPETTTFGKAGVQRIAGLYDATMSGAGIWNSDASSGIDAVFSSLLATCQATLVNFLPGGSSTGCRMYSACMVLSKYDITTSVNAVVAVAWEFQLGSGSVTSTCSL